MRCPLAALCVSLALAACAKAEDVAPAWSAAELDDLEHVATAAPAEGLAAETAALAFITAIGRLSPRWTGRK